MSSSLQFLYVAHVDNEMYLSRALERLGGNALSKDSEPDIGAAFFKFAVVTKELSALMKTLVCCKFILSRLLSTFFISFFVLLLTRK